MADGFSIRRIASGSGGAVFPTFPFFSSRRLAKALAMLSFADRVGVLVGFAVIGVVVSRVELANIGVRNITYTAE